MAIPRTHIPKSVKEQLIQEAGNKCANPGCHNVRVEFHHIKEWAVWGTNDEEHLIALCPTCHDAAHYGRLKLDDVMLYHWKTFRRSPVRRDVLHVDWGGPAYFFVATTAVRSKTAQANVIDLSQDVFVRYRMDNEGSFLVQLSLEDASGKTALRITDNRVTYSGTSSLRYDARPGRIQITCTSPEEFIPDWLSKKVEKFDAAHAWRDVQSQSHFASPFTLLDIEVVAPSQVRIHGAFCSPKGAVLITSKKIYLASPSCCTGVSGFGQFILNGKSTAFCASSSRTSYYRALGGGAFFELPK